MPIHHDHIVKSLVTVLAILLCWRLASNTLEAVPVNADMLNTKHNLSVSGPGPIRATSETRICIFCHTPHNATPQSPLWNKELEPRSYTVYTSPTLKAAPVPQPFGPTKLCLSCHDGTIAMGAVVNPSGGIGMDVGTFSSGSLSDFGLDLSSHHPVSFAYHDALPNPELVATPPSNLDFGGADEVHCNTCHDPHNDAYGRFLVMDHRNSALCITCHQMTGWEASKHATSTVSVAGILPRPPKTWPTWTQMGEWGCETCHTPHFASTPEELLNFTNAPPDPYSCTSAGCHSSQPPPGHGPAIAVRSSARSTAGSQGMADIAGQIVKRSAHHQAAFQQRAPGKFDLRTASSDVPCASCHNPHQVTDRPASAPNVSGMLQGVSGVDRNGVEIPQANYEYEVCFKCHSDNTPDIDLVPRVVETTNTRLAFDPSNTSYHPVISIGKNMNVPSIPSSFKPASTASDVLYCTDCHADDNEVSHGPHGSDFAPILKQRYETSDNTPESFENYALCYGCHDRSNILSDRSFQKKGIAETASGGGHSGHLADGAPCSVCHDPHGVSGTVANTLGSTGSHTSLINFDTRVVQPKPGNSFPIYESNGSNAGSCTLVCHGKLHDSLSYP